MNTIDRDAVIEECAKVCDGMFIGQHGGVRVASLRCADALRALKSQPAQQDPRDEALRLAIGKLARAAAHVWPTCPQLYDELTEALAAIDALKGEN